MIKSIFKKLIFILLFLKSFEQACDPGCLKCSKTNACQLCDFTKNLFLVDSQCQPSKIDNCFKFDLQGSCLTCNKNYFLDTSLGNCVSVTTEQQIANCEFYQSPSACRNCAADYFVQGSICQAATTKVENCQVYSGDGLCQECLANHVLSIDNKRCFAIQEVSNCLTYSSIECVTCKDNFFQQSNAKQYEIKNQLLQETVQAAQTAIQTYNTLIQQTENNCYQVSLQNCKKLESFASCGVCEDGYYPKNGVCTQNPLDSIPHCYTYTKLNKCYSCEPGYHLSIDYTCQKNIEVKNCALYQGNAYGETRCLNCESEFYLSQKNMCTKRTIFSIDNCKQLHTSRDSCGQCSEGFRLTTDNLKCLAEIQFCSSYFNSTIKDSSFVCLQCQNGYYLNSEGICVLGTVTNCKTYHRSMNLCQYCNDTFYLDASGNCVEHQKVENCVRYHPFINAKCEECSFDSYKIQRSTSCVETTVQNCQTHLKKDYCGSCEDLFMLDEGQCISMSSTFPNCLRGEYGVCKKCKTGYILEKGKCEQTHAAVNQNCQDSSYAEGSSTENAVCEVCKANTIPFDFKGSYMCVQGSRLVAQGLQPNIPNCLNYRLDKDGTLKCSQCSGNKNIALDGTCTDQVCTELLYSHFLETDREKVKIIFKNYCKENTGQACSKFGVKKTTSSFVKQVQYGCTECPDANIQFVMVDSTSQNFTFYNASNFFWKNEIMCFAENAIADYIVSSQITGCQYFYMIRMGVVGCLKCKPGKKGTIKNYIIQNCFEYDLENLTCKLCQKDYYLSEDKSECIASLFADADSGVNLTHMDNCLSKAFDNTKCFQCKPGYFLKNDGTVCTAFSANISNCDAYTHNQDPADTTAHCELCESGFQLSSDKTECWEIINNCAMMNSANDCKTCKQNYARSADGTSCDQVDDCQLNQANTSTCQVPDPSLSFKKTNHCVQATVIIGCDVYKNDGDCEKCEDGKYLLENACIEEESFTSDTFTELKNCKIFEVVDSEAAGEDDKYGCKVCKNGYRFADEERTLQNYQCIQNGYFILNDAVTNQLNVTKYTTQVCALFDFSLNKCATCGTGYYWSNGICCETGEYNQDQTCITIALDSCEQAERIGGLDGELICLKCEAGNNLFKGVCCDEETFDFLDLDSNCASFSSNCIEVDPQSDKCSACDSGFYLTKHDSYCCAEEQVHSDDGSTCTALSDASFDNIPYISNLRNSTTKCLQFDRIHNQCIKCIEDYSFNGYVCQETSKIFENCDEVSQLLQTCVKCESGYQLSDIGICCATGKEIDLKNALCVNTLQYTEIPGCAQHKLNDAEDGYDCAFCQEGKVLMSGICCFSYQKESEGSCVDLIYDSNCLYSSLTDQTCSKCFANNSSQLKQYLYTGKCCPLGQYSDDGSCTVANDVNCLRIKESANTECDECKQGYFIDADSICTVMLTNCLMQEETGVCLQCKTGYVLNAESSACLAVTLQQLEGCKKVDPALDDSDKCLECLDNYNSYDSTNGKYCCPLNYYREAVLNACVKIPDPNCMTYDENKKCLQCFYNEAKCSGEYYPLKTIFIRLYLSRGHCVKQGYFYENNEIQEIQEANCLELSNQGSSCTKCANNHILSNGHCLKMLNCSSYKDHSGVEYYQSSGHCCPINTYWDTVENNCMSLLDDNCKKSQDGEICQECASDFSAQRFEKLFVQTDLYKVPYNCLFNQRKKSFYPCVPNTMLAADKMNALHVQLQENCTNFNSNDKECVTCAEGYYQKHQQDICCLEGYTSIWVGMARICVELDKVDENCDNFDFEQQVCLICADGFVVSLGRCCASGTYFNAKTGACDLSFPNCEIYDAESQNCMQCQNGYYFSMGLCCAEGKASEDGSTCEDLDNGCKAKSDDGNCILCDNSTYLNLGKCCSPAQFFNLVSGTCDDISNLSGNGYALCNKLDDSFNCVECTADNLLIYGRCCGPKQIWNYDDCATPTQNATDNCLEYEQFSIEELTALDAPASLENFYTCKTCHADYHKVNGRCILKTADLYDLQTLFGLDAFSQRLLDLQRTCIEWKAGVCIECKAGLIPTQNGDDIICSAGTVLEFCSLYDIQGNCIQCLQNRKVITANDPDDCSGGAFYEHCELANDSLCLKCKEGYTYDPNEDKCVEIIIDFCLETNADQSLCQKCEDGYSFNATGTACVLLSTLPANCTQGRVLPDGSFQCNACDSTTFLNSTNGFTCDELIQSINFCKLHLKWVDGSDICQECYSGYRLEDDQKKCCMDDELLNPNTKQCQKIYQYDTDCKVFDVSDLENLSLAQLNCTECEDGFYVSNGRCCAEGKFFDGLQCVVSSVKGTQNCKQFINNGLCLQIDQNDLTANCLSGYITFLRCCEEGFYFDIAKEECLAIPNYLSLDGQTCTQIDSDMNCVKCSDMTTGRVWEGRCVPSGKYLDSFTYELIEESSTPSSFANCSTIENYKCLSCKAGFQLDEDGLNSASECCWDGTNPMVYDSRAQKCRTLTDLNCTTYDFNSKTCSTCASGYFTGSKCCAEGEFYFAGSCTSITSLTESWALNCNKITTEDFEQKICTECNSGFGLQNGLCCGDGQWNIGGRCHERALQCTKLDFQNQCTECIDGSFLSGAFINLCCAAGKVLVKNNTTNAWECQTVSSATITNCQVYAKENVCLQCASGNYLVSKNFCCPIGTKKVEDACSAVLVPQCIKFEDENDSNLCLKCTEDHFPIKYKDGQELKSICCANGETLDFSSKKCVPLSVFTNNCKTLDIQADANHPYGLGVQCETEKVGFYLSSGVACAENKYWDGDSCEDIPGTFPDCARVSFGECIKCSDDSTHYLTGGQCCVKGYYNLSGTCTDATTKNCDIFFHECPEDIKEIDCETFTKGEFCKICSTGHYQTYSGKCCPLKSYFDGECKIYNNTNVTTGYRSALSTCNEFDQNLHCLQCETGEVSDDGLSCCESNPFVDLNTACQETQTTPVGCSDYDPLKFECKTCSATYYLTDHICCENGYFYSREKLRCLSINTSELQIDENCDQYDELLGCLHCKATFLLNDQQECISVPSQCLQFDPDLNFCEKCEDTHYSSEGKCCPLGQYNASGTCVLISTSGVLHCEIFHNGQCDKCEDGYYEAHGYCCLEGSYHVNHEGQVHQCVAIQNNDDLANCLRFGADKFHCLKCKPDYVLITYSSSKSLCQKITKDDDDSDHPNYKCLEYQSFYDTQEKLKCTKCAEAQSGVYILQDYDTPPTFTEITNKPTLSHCSILDIRAKFKESTLKCLRCESTHYLNSFGKCVLRSKTNCFGDVPHNQDICLACNEGFYLTKAKECKEIPLTNCIAYDDAKNLCIKCDPDVAEANMQLHYKIEDGILVSECVDSQLYPNIKLKKRIFNGYIDSCNQDDEDAVTDKFASNLEYYYDFFYSIHYCSNDKIPVAFVRSGIDQTGMPVGIGQYSIENNSNVSGHDLDDFIAQETASLSPSEGQSTQCITSLRDIFPYFTTDVIGTNLPSNCAMLMVNVSKQLSTAEALKAKPDLSQLSAFCTACKDGYKPLRNARLPLHVYQCQTVANCAVNPSGPPILNGCSQCASGHAYGVTQSQVDYTVCRSTSDTHCIAVLSTGKCLFCQNGYLPNYDGKCSKITAPHCSDSNFSFVDQFELKNFGFVNAFLGDNFGCKSCEDGFFGVLQTQQRLLCASSQTLIEKAFAAESEIYTSECKFYGLVSKRVVCKTCNDNFIITQEHKCIAVGNLANCDIALSANECYQCKTTHVNVNKQCVEKTISNCKVYLNGPSQQTLQCEICEDGFLMKNGECVEGTVENCAGYNQQVMCERCKSGFVLTHLENQQKCIAVAEALHPNCLQYNSSSFQENSIVCQQCSSSQFIVEDLNQATDICIKIPPVENCTKYEKGDRLIDSTFKCVDCQDSYKLENGKCTLVTQITPNCENILLPDYQCLQCKAGYYLNEAGTECLRQPEGVAGCSYYKTSTVCKICSSGLYLKNNECLSVPQNNLIDGCKYYQNASVCMQCEQGKILQNNQCLSPVASCLTYFNINECSSCIEGQGIQVKDGKRICVDIPTKDFCSEYRKIDPFECVACINGYYLNGGTCIQISDLIVGCIQYESINRCSLCEPGLVLAQDRQSCKNIFLNANCSQYKENDPFCVYCKQGYSVKNGVCIQNSTDVPAGCMGINNNKECIVCLPGFTMNNNLECK